MWQKRLLGMGLLVGALLTHLPSLGFAQQTDPVIDPLDVRAGRFFGLVSQKKISPAYDDLLGARSFASKDERKILEDQTALIETTYGSYRGFERVYARQVGSDLVFVKYLYKCSRFPVLWHVTFYRSTASGELGPDTWQVVSVRFDTDLELLTLLKDGATK